MFETSYMLKTTHSAMNDSQLKLDHDYYKCWEKLENNKLQKWLFIY